MIDPEKMYWFTSSSGRIEFQIPGECVTDCHQPGSNDAAVSFWRRQSEVVHALADIHPDTLVDELREYGAWDDEELLDHGDNLDRILWLACGDISEAVLSGDYTE